MTVRAHFRGGPLNTRVMVVPRADYELQCAIPEPVAVASPEPEEATVRVGRYRMVSSYTNDEGTRAYYDWRG